MRFRPEGSADGQPTAWAEFARGWPLVLTAACGVGLGVSGLLTYNVGLFAFDLARDVGLSRTAFGAAFFGSTLAMAAAMPNVGKLIDRFGPRPMAACGSLMLSVGFLALSQITSVLAYCLVLLLIGLLTGTSTPVAYTRAVSAEFQRADFVQDSRYAIFLDSIFQYLDIDKYESRRPSVPGLVRSGPHSDPVSASGDGVVGR